jgi:hypothetical protein
MKILPRFARTLLAASALLLAGLAGTTTAVAKTTELTYDFTDPSYGSAGWQALNDPPRQEGQQGPWYESTFTPGTGLRITPRGNGGVAYSNALGAWWWYAPLGATVKRVRVEHLSGKAFAGQIGRVWMASLDPDPQPRSPSVLREVIASGATWDDESYLFQTPPGQTAGGFGLWLYSRPCNVLVPGDCKPADPADGAYVRLGKVTFTIDDPSRPTLAVSGVDTGTLWTNSRTVDLGIVAEDKQTGVEQISAEIRSQTGTRTLDLGRWQADAKHTVPRAYATPPLAERQSVDRVFGVAEDGRTTLIVRAKNGAGLAQTTRATVRVDRRAPQIDWPSAVRPGATIRIRDTASGFKRSTLSVAGVDVQGCAEGQRSCVLRVPTDVAPRSTVSVNVEDQAGNVVTAQRRTPATSKPRPGRGGRTPLPDPGLNVGVRGDVERVVVLARPDGIPLTQDVDDPEVEPLTVAEGVPKKGGTLSLQPNMADPAVAQFVRERDGLINVEVMAYGRRGITMSSASWFVNPDGSVARTRARGAGDLGIPPSRPLKSRPVLPGGVPVKDEWIAPKVQLDLRAASPNMVPAAAAPGSSRAAGDPPPPDISGKSTFCSSDGNTPDRIKDRKVERVLPRAPGRRDRAYIEVNVAEAQTTGGVKFDLTLSERNVTTTGSAITFGGGPVRTGRKVTVRGSSEFAASRTFDGRARHQIYVRVYLTEYRWIYTCETGETYKVNSIEPTTWEGKSRSRPLSLVRCGKQRLRDGKAVLFMAGKETLKSTIDSSFTRGGDSSFEWKGLAVAFENEVTWGKGKSQTMTFGRNDEGKNYLVCWPGGGERISEQSTWWATGTTLDEDSRP